MSLRKNSFNLIEILISMIVIIFAMFIIISFLPLANQQNSQAINQTHLANFAQNIISYIKSQPQDVIYSNNNSQYSMIEGFPTSKSTFETNTSHFNTRNPVNENGVIKIYSHNSSDSIFLIRSESIVNNIDVKEAEIEARIFRREADFHYSTHLANSSASPSVNTSHTTGQNYASLTLSGNQIKPSESVLPYKTNYQISTESTRIMIEFSWPLNREYEKREKEFVFFDHQIITGKQI